MNDFKIAKLDWQDILKTSTSWIYYTFKEWRRLSSEDSSQSIDGVHWRDVGPTIARVRVITLEWYIDRIWNAEELTSIQYLETIFALQWDLSTLEEKTLYIKDIYDQEWIIKVKIKEPLEMIEWDDSFLWSHWKWRVVLESTYNPIYKGFEDIIVAWTEWNTWWFNFPFTLPIDFFDVYNVIECITNWNTSTSAKIVINANANITDPLVVKNITNDTFFWLNVDAVPGDIIIIDSNAKSVTKNGVNILWNRIIWSVWPKINKTTQFIIEDKDGWLLSSDFWVNIIYNNSLF